MVCLRFQRAITPTLIWHMRRRFVGLWVSQRGPPDIPNVCNSNLITVRNGGLTSQARWFRPVRTFKIVNLLARTAPRTETAFPAPIIDFFSIHRHAAGMAVFGAILMLIGIVVGFTVHVTGGGVLILIGLFLCFMAGAESR